jgi:hypothetical protein
MKKLYTILLAALFSMSIINAQNTIVTENFGASYAHNESMSTNSSGWSHTGAGDFVHKIVSGSGASGSNCFAQLGTSGASSASHDIQLHAGNTYEFKAYVKTVNSKIYVTLRINSGGADVATSGNTSANGVWEELSCSYTPTADEMASFQFVKTQGQLANIDKIKVTCTSCPDKNYVSNFNDSKEGWISGGQSNLTLGNDAMNINATGTAPVARSGSLTADLNLNAADYNRARVTFKTPYASAGAGVGKLYFYNLAAGNSHFAVFNLPRDAANTTTFQTVEIDLSNPTTGTFSGPIARVGFRAPWGIASGDVCHLQKIELFHQKELFFSEYAEGSSNNKYLEIYNGNSFSVSLDNYAFPSVSNAPTTPGSYEYWNTFPANASIAAGDVYVIAHPSADASILAQADHTYLYLSNGDDGFALVKGGTWNDDGDGNIDPGEMTGFTLLDHIGDWGGDPGAGWDVAGVSNATKDHTLVRKASVTGPNACWAQTCGNGSAGTNSTDSEWIVYPQNTWTYLGSHPHTVASPPTIDVTFEVNTAKIYNNGNIVGPGGIYVGGGIVGDAQAHQLTQSTTDTLMWTGTKSILASDLDTANSSAFILLNNPTGAGDWSAKEQLGGQPCGAAAWNDRYFPVILSDTTLKFCFGSCETDGSCPPPSPPSGPTNNAADPTSLAVDVISIFSDTYTDVSGSDFNPNWGQNGHGSVNASFDPGTGNTVLAYTNFNYQGVQFGSNQDISPMEYLHVDIWVEGTFDPRVFVISGGTEVPHTITNTGANNWISADIPVTGITGNLSNCYQFKFDGGNVPTDAIYVDNLYFWRTPGYNPNPPSTVDISFEVNTANIYNNGDVVGGNGIYLGGGIVGDAQAILLTQSTTDTLLWTGVYTAPLSLLSQANSSAYVLLNSPNDGSDWGKKEDLNGLPCGAAAYNDRYFPVITSDTTLKLCFGSCETDGSCPPPPASFVDITLTVNTSNITVDPAGIFLAGGGNFGNPGDNPLTQDATNPDLWSIVVNKPQGFSSFYIFSNGDAGDYSGKEQLGGLFCGDPNNYDDRFMGPIQSDTTIQHCFGTCVFDGTCPLPPVQSNVTFAVDMSQYTGSQSAPYTVNLNGTFNGWCGGCNAMTDADGDGVWEVTIPLDTGLSIEYKFTVNGWNDQEQFAGGESCTVTNGVNTNRFLVIPPSDDTLPTVCFNSCNACVPVVTGPQCDYVINMQDSWGDGWNGSSIDVSVNGNNAANWSISGSSGTDTISTINGDVVEFTFISGSFSYDTEITFQITKPDGSTLGSYGPFATDGGNTGIIATDTSNATCLPATVNVTFQVDMGLVTAGFTTPEVNGTWNSWCGNCNPMTDADGDGVWEATIPLTTGNYEYKYSADAWTIQEMNDPTASCTNGNPVNTNRVLTVGTSDMTISTVCWGSCSPCVYPGTCGIYTLELTDSYGDGWNGGSLDVVVNGTAVFSGLTIATGFGPESYQIPVDISDVVDFNYTAGSYPFENAYQVIDQNGVLIIDQGAGGAPSSVSGVSACPACVDPSGLTASNVTATSADLSWTAGGTETEWFLIVNGAGTTQTSTTANLTGLIPDSSYTAQVYAVCAPGDTSGASISVSFATPCAAVTAPYSQDFSSGTLPSCWSQSAASGDGWRFTGAPAYDASGNGRTSGTYAWIDFSGTDAGTVMDLVPVDVSALTVAELEFAYFSYDVSNGTTPANKL